MSFWNRESFRYYTAGDGLHERFAGRYGIRAAWRVLGEQFDARLGRLWIVLGR